jgi:TolB protein
MQLVEPDRVLYRGVTFSPDSNFIYYAAYQGTGGIGTLYQMPVLGGTPAKVITDIDSPVTFSPDGRRVAFTRYYPKERESSIVVADIDGKNERRVATLREPAYYPMTGPAWSPDGKIIATPYRGRDESGAYMVLVGIKPDGGGEEPLTPQKWNFIGQIAWEKNGRSLAAIGWHRESCVLADQIWSISYPDGKARRVTNDTNGYEGITMAANGSMVTIRAQRISQIYTANDTTLRNAKQITSGFGDHFSQRLGMVWSPDGKLLYSSIASGNPDIWAMDADGRNPKQLTFDLRGDFLPHITSDGKYVVFVSDRKGTTNIWRMDIDGSNPRQLTYGRGEYTPSLSPDGKWIIYFTNEYGLPGLSKVSIDGGDPIRLSDTYCQVPSVSPDGKLIACFYLEPETGNSKPAIIEYESGKIIRVFEKSPFPFPAALHWSADSRSFIYSAIENGVSNLWLQPIDGSTGRILSDFKGERIYRLAISVDGKRIAFERGNDVTDVVLITNFEW